MPPRHLLAASGAHSSRQALEDSGTLWKESWKLKQRRESAKPSIKGLVSYADAPLQQHLVHLEAGQLTPEKHTNLRKECQQILHFPKTKCFQGHRTERCQPENAVGLFSHSEAALKHLWPGLASLWPPECCTLQPGQVHILFSSASKGLWPRRGGANPPATG